MVGGWGVILVFSDIFVFIDVGIGCCEARDAGFTSSLLGELSRSTTRYSID